MRVDKDAATQRLRPLTWLSHGLELLRNPTLIVWCLFVGLTPFYVFKSGLPQPADLLLLLLLPMALVRWRGKLDPRTSAAVRSLLAFLGWVCVVSFGWALILGKWSNPKDYLIFPLFYFFNVAVFLVAGILSRRDPERFVTITVDVVFVTIVFQVVATFFARGDDARTTLFFNNPNQLGYYVLLSACLIAMAQRRLGLSKIRAALAISGCGYLALLSASRASLAGIIALLALLLFSNPRTIIITCLTAAALLTLGGPVSDAIDKAELRAEQNRDTKGGFAEERGYDRLWKNPEYLPLGAGEGDVARFAEPGQKPHELHSSFGALLFGYGIVGIGLFMLFCFRLVRGAPLRDIAMLLPVGVYTVAHNGLRFTSFWILLAVFAALQRVGEAKDRRTVEQRQAASSSAAAA